MAPFKKIFLIILFLGQVGCATYHGKVGAARNDLEAGRYEAALTKLQALAEQPLVTMKPEISSSVLAPPMRATFMSWSLEHRPPMTVRHSMERTWQAMLPREQWNPALT